MCFTGCSASRCVVCTYVAVQLHIIPTRYTIHRVYFYLTTALHVSGVTITHLQEHKTTVTTASGNRYTVLLCVAIVEELELICVCYRWRCNSYFSSTLTFPICISFKCFILFCSVCMSGFCNVCVCEGFVMCGCFW